MGNEQFDSHVTLQKLIKDIREIHEELLKINDQVKKLYKEIEISANRRTVDEI